MASQNTQIRILENSGDISGKIPELKFRFPEIPLREFPITSPIPRKPITLSEMEIRPTFSVYGKSSTETNKMRRFKFSCFFPYTEKFPYTGLIGKTGTDHIGPAIRFLDFGALKPMTTEMTLKALPLKARPLKALKEAMGLKAPETSRILSAILPFDTPLKAGPFRYVTGPRQGEGVSPKAGGCS